MFEVRFVRRTVFLAFVSMGCSSARIPARSTASQSSAMEYVEVCRHDGDCRKFSRLIMGTDHLAQADWTGPNQPGPSDEEVFKVLDEAARLGINIFDTAPIYVGGVENILGRWMKSRRALVRDEGFYSGAGLNPDRKLYALSKGGFPFDLFYSQTLEAGSHSPELISALRAQGILPKSGDLASAEAQRLQNVPPGTYASRLFGSEAQITQRVLAELRHSTDNLNDDVAIYLMHRDDGDFLKFNEIAREKTPVAAILRALSAPEVVGKFWGLGWSNWRAGRVEESVRLANGHGEFAKPLLNSPYFSLFEMSERTIHAGGVQVTHAEMMDPNFERGIRLNPYSPLGGYSVFDKPEPRWQNAKADARRKFEAGDAYWQNVYPAIFTEANEARYARILAFTERFNRERSTNYTIDQMINAYALAHRRTDFLTIGPVNVEQVRRTVASLKLARMLTEQDLNYLHAGKALNASQ